MMMKLIPIAAALLATTASPALAQDGEAPTYRVRIGAGAQVKPEFYGGDKMEVGPMWDIDIARGDAPFSFEAPDDHLAIPIISKNGFAVGPVANIEWKRKEKDVGAPVGTVKTTVEVGGFAEYMAMDSTRLRAELRKGINGHEGLVGHVGVDQIWRDGDKYVFSIGPRLLFSDAKYQRAYFGVSPAAALAAGLPAYRPDGGIHAAALASGLSYQFNPQFGLFGYGRWERLLGDAGKSPIVRELGSRNQFSAGIGLNYTFNFAR
jgi:outer membrane protein